ncbi:MAG: hypothetical protein HGA16_00110 [Candidatus Moranbacteria bacterium]|nr:hypothetical protein [Candidatus Moranbacteria bacterium]
MTLFETGKDLRKLYARLMIAARRTGWSLKRESGEVEVYRMNATENKIYFSYRLPGKERYEFDCGRQRVILGPDLDYHEGKLQVAVYNDDQEVSLEGASEEVKSLMAAIIEELL